MLFKFNLEAKRDELESRLKNTQLNAMSELIYKKSSDEYRDEHDNEKRNEAEKERLKNEIKSILEIEDKNDGTKEIKIKHSDVIKDWFPESNCHIFMSHSHKDRDLAVKIANYLYTYYGITTFIDSDFWQYVDDAILDINSHYSKFPKPNDKLLKYDSCLLVGTNFYLTLSNALMDAIDKSDCCLFLNTENSIADSKNNEEVTYSPWIYTELNILDKIRENPHRDRDISITEAVAGVEGYEIIKSSKVATESYRVRMEFVVDPTFKLPTINSELLIEILTKPEAVIPTQELKSQANVILSEENMALIKKVKAIHNLDALYDFITPRIPKNSSSVICNK
ncbi:toll/interleukin-1 receptor domain-containing protein [Plesiomonas shigelloides]|uniref:toll/interleukin-1 receptor domain-containing protein n=1 Tax=Plesiomonas shigelloides TaxID=703 RepID=UPI0012618588|nr:toll/interleukin-1 receptor domain-containing protein [Plesiomonas shigelloides]KAB7670871.1 hypothetical protein GBN25_01010 [Plesiomonas shigelloides]